MTTEWLGVDAEAEAHMAKGRPHMVAVEEETEERDLSALLERAIAFGMVMGVRSVGIHRLAKEQGLSPITGGEPDWPPPDDVPSGGPAG